MSRSTLWSRSPRGLSPRQKSVAFRELVANASSRRIGTYTVYVQDGITPFTITKRVDGRLRRRPGEIRHCQKCGKEFFAVQNGKEWSHCSPKCGAEQASRKKRARTASRGGPKKATLDHLFSLIVRAVGSCRRCGKTSALQCAHILSRRYLGTRYHFGNAMCLCSGCHMYYTYRPLEWERYVSELIGAGSLEELKHAALSFNGPLDRVATAEMLYAEAASRGVNVGVKNAGGGMGFSGLRDPEASMRDRENATKRKR